MSRLSKEPTKIPAGVTITLDEKGTMIVKGPKGELTRSFKLDVIKVTVGGDTVAFAPVKETIFSKALVGTYAAHVRNMIVGVTEGYVKKLEVEGVGYRWEMKGKKLVMQLGFSHPVEVEIPEEIKVEVGSQTEMTISGIDKELVGQFAAKVRSQKKPEPYKGKGIRYEGEYIRRKQGKRAV